MANSRIDRNAMRGNVCYSGLMGHAGLCCGRRWLAGARAVPRLGRGVGGARRGLQNFVCAFSALGPLTAGLLDGGGFDVGALSAQRTPSPPCFWYPYNVQALFCLWWIESLPFRCVSLGRLSVARIIFVIFVIFKFPKISPWKNLEILSLVWLYYFMYG